MDLYIKVREGALEISVFSLRDFFFFSSGKLNQKEVNKLSKAAQVGSGRSWAINFENDLSIINKNT